MLNFIKNKDREWFNKLFLVIKEQLENNIDEINLKNELKHTHLERNLMNYIIEKIFNDECNIISENVIMTDNNIKIGFTNIRINQRDAITNIWDNIGDVTINKKEYKLPISGICCQATGSGKTFICLHLIKIIGELNNYHNNMTILWFTERKDILTDLFLIKKMINILIIKKIMKNGKT